ncbi:FecR family protein [Pseudothauera nasutitermitis]|uniref:FecR family protein n=1 Tax=Pseudothauera nasutitermitis TaxID=2565930 RepID=A0A4S4B5B9_9RHOO|nr:FecR family protein [Pseudothauera nasutitermitis]THF66167.1 FecR family protein [Pseudothauera nasutitermitis]
MSPPPQPDFALLKEAADWATTLHFGTPSSAEHDAFERWRGQSPQHEAAWARAQSVLSAFGQLDGDTGKGTLHALERMRGRRRSLRVLGALLLAAPAGWLAWNQAPWREWSADLATVTGERRTWMLPDDSRLVLNTASAVNIAYGEAERRIVLVEGEILVTTHADPSPVFRPFIVETAQGQIRALGTRFGVRRVDDDRTRVSVFEHAVEIQPLDGPPRILQAGEQADFDAFGVRAGKPVDAGAALWEHGMLVARNMRLAEVVAELGRHRRGILRCDPAVADLRVSGSISLGDSDAALALLAQTMPLRVARITPYWITVAPR